MEERRKETQPDGLAQRLLPVAAMAAALVTFLGVFMVLGGPRSVTTLAHLAQTTPTPVATATPRATATPTRTPIPTATNTPTPLPTATSTPVPTATALPVPYTITQLQVPAGSASTVQVTLAPGAWLEGHFTANLDVSFSILAPSGAAAYAPGRVSGRQPFFVVAPAAGAYTLHFDNRFSIFTGKQIELQYRVRASGQN